MSTATAPSGILVGVDGSPFSDAAVRWAAREAAMHHEALTLMMVTEHHSANSYDLDKVQAPRRAQRDEGDRILDAAAQLVAEELGDRSLPHLRTEFLFAHTLGTLIDASKEVRLVVVGCRGMGALDRLTLGSVSTGLVYHAHCAVAVIHTDSKPDEHAPILVGIDGSATSELATAIAFDEASLRRAPLIAMHAWADALHGIGHFNWTHDEERGREVLSERLAGWQEQYPDVSVTPKVIHQDAGRWLANHSDQAQLVVVGSHGRGGFATMLLGSVSATVVHAAQVPVIVARQS